MRPVRGVGVSSCLTCICARHRGQGQLHRRDHTCLAGQGPVPGALSLAGLTGASRKRNGVRIRRAMTTRATDPRVVRFAWLTAGRG